MTKTEAAVETLSDINPDVVFEVMFSSDIPASDSFAFYTPNPSMFALVYAKFAAWKSVTSPLINSASCLYHLTILVILFHSLVVLSTLLKFVLAPLHLVYLSSQTKKHKSKSECASSFALEYSDFYHFHYMLSLYVAIFNLSMKFASC